MSVIPSNKLTANFSTDEKLALLFKQLERQQRITIGDYQLSKIKTWEDFQRSSGFTYSGDASLPVTAANIKAAFALKRTSLERGEELLEKPTTQEVSVVEQSTSKGAVVEDEYSIIECLRNNPKVKNEHFQERAAANILRSFMKYNHKARALSAGVGAGKTFILAAVIKELWRRKWTPLMHTVSPYPIMYVTRASVVTQTQRVMTERFGLEASQVFVTNIDQLRASLGDNLIHEQIQVVDGYPHKTYTWLEMLAPALIILDESHCVKNVDSTQSRIMQAFNDIREDGHYSIYASATLWTRVIESKCFAVATKLEW